MRTTSPITTPAAWALAACIAPAAFAGPAPIWDNGPFITDFGIGAGGADVSRTQSGAAISLAQNGGPGAPSALADDFPIVGGPIALARMDWYTTITNGGTEASPFTAAFVRLYDQSPASGAEPIAGDTTTNRLQGAAWTGAYRVSSANTASSNASATRPIWRLDLDMSWAPPLSGGQYWVAVSVVGTSPTTPAALPQGILVTPNNEGGAGLQFFSGNWITVFDIPFRLFGAAGTSPCNIADIVSIGGFPPPDGELTVDDYTSFINAFAGDELLADIVSIGGFPPPDGELTVDDYTSFINAFAEGC